MSNCSSPSSLKGFLLLSIINIRGLCSQDLWIPVGTYSEECSYKASTRIQHCLLTTDEVQMLQHNQIRRIVSFHGVHLLLSTRFLGFFRTVCFSTNWRGKLEWRTLCRFPFSRQGLRDLHGDHLGEKFSLRLAASNELGTGSGALSLEVETLIELNPTLQTPSKLSVGCPLMTSQGSPDIGSGSHGHLLFLNYKLFFMKVASAEEHGSRHESFDTQNIRFGVNSNGRGTSKKTWPLVLQ